MGFGNQYENWPGGIECFYRFLADGNDGWEHGRQVAERVRGTMRPESFDHFLHGEGYTKDAATTKGFVESLPITRIDRRYVVFKPLSQVDPAVERPETVHFLVDPDRLSALVVLASYAGPGNENVIIPQAAGCQSMGIIAMREARSERPRAVVGLVDISARNFMTRQFGHDQMTVSVPFGMFERLETDAPGSFLAKSQWRDLLEP